MESALEAMDAGVMADAVVTELEGAMGALAELTGGRWGRTSRSGYSPGFVLENDAGQGKLHNFPIVSGGLE